MRRVEFPGRELDYIGCHVRDGCSGHRPQHRPQHRRQHRPHLQLHQLEYDQYNYDGSQLSADQCMRDLDG